MALVLFATVRPTNISSTSSDVVNRARRAFTRSGSAVHYVPTPRTQGVPVVIDETNNQSAVPSSPRIGDTRPAPQIGDTRPGSASTPPVSSNGGSNNTGGQNRRRRG